MRSIVLAVAVLVAAMTVAARADNPDPRRKVIVLEYRASSSALSGVAKRVAAAIGKQTSMTILGPDQTRAVFGDHLDQAVVKCAGDADCVARIGGKVGANEVILVGVSELGDVILTMQRINVSSRQVDGRIADSLAADAQPSDAQVDAYLTRLLPPTDFLRYGVIDIVASLPGASVTVSGENKGLTPIQPLKLRAPATYDIRVEKTGFVPFSTKVVLPPEGTIKVEAELSKRGQTSWYQHWYVIVGAGALAAGLAGGSIYLATRGTPGGDRVGVTGEIH